MIDINETFTVAAPPAEVYSVLSDPHAVVECVAGASLGEQHEDGSYDGKMTVKFSALRVAFAGKVKLDLDEENHTGTVHASGRDGQGGTKFQADATFKVEPADGGNSSTVHANGEVNLSGKLASVIEGAAGAVVKRMTGEFVEALSLRCASGNATLGPSTPTATPAPTAAPAPSAAAGPAESAAATDTAATTTAATAATTATPAAPAHAAPEPTPAAAVLLLHGFGGSPNGVRPLGPALADAGSVVSIPRLPGHGTRWKDLGRTTWNEWYAAVVQAARELRSKHEQVFVAGLDVGATLALHLAAERSVDVAGIMLVNPVLGAPLGTPKPLGLISLVRRSMPAVRGDVKQGSSSDVGYDRISLRAVKSLLALTTTVRAELGRVECPVLLATSAVDHVVATADSTAVWAGLAGSDRRQLNLANSYHVAPLDGDAALLAAECVEFVQSHALVRRS
jgi:esterase/lipase/carbon monoxide dehydrogenase subunit G